MKNLILPFLVAVLLGIGACDDTTINPPDDKKDTTVIKDTTNIKDSIDSLKSFIKEDIVFVKLDEAEKDSLGERKYFLYAVNKDGSGLRKILQLPNGYDRFVLSPDGRSILVSANNKTYKIGIDSNIIEMVSEKGADSFGWFPNSKSFLLLENNTVYISDGKYKNQIITNYSSNDIPLIAPTGQTLIFIDPQHIYSTNTSGQNKKVLVQSNTSSAYWMNLKISPDAKQLAYIVLDSGYSKLMMANIDGSNTHIITKMSYTNTPNHVLCDLSSKGKSLVIMEAMVPGSKPPYYYGTMNEVDANGSVLSSSGIPGPGVGGGYWDKEGEHFIYYGGAITIVNSITKSQLNLKILGHAQWVGTINVMPYR
jgi:hypothetical protein